MNQSYDNDKYQCCRISEGHEECDSITFCFYIVSLPGHSISKYILFFQLQVAIFVLFLFNDITVGLGVVCWWNIEMGG